MKYIFLIFLLNGCVIIKQDGTKIISKEYSVGAGTIYCSNTSRIHDAYILSGKFDCGYRHWFR